MESLQGERRQNYFHPDDFLLCSPCLCIEPPGLNRKLTAFILRGDDSFFMIVKLKAETKLRFPLFDQNDTYTTFS